MSNSITIRLTPDRERLLKLFKLRHNIQKTSEAIELALKLGFDEQIDYLPKINNVAGCLQFENGENADEIVRNLRGR